jgi:hypothetical protein
MEPRGLSPHLQEPASLVPRLFWIFHNMINSFYGEELLEPRPTPKLEDHPLSAVRDCFIQYIRSYLPYLEAVSPFVTG